ncbi:sensor histidine kinase [soil metagenome]
MFRTLTSRQLAIDIGVPSVLGLLTVPWFLYGSSLGFFALVGLIGAVALRRVSPGLALAVLWAATLLQVVLQISPNPADAAVPVVIFATSAYGTARVKWLGFASSFVGAAIAAFATLVLPVLPSLISNASNLALGKSILQLMAGSLPAFVFFAAALGLFLLSWTLGLLVKSRTAAGDSRRAAAVAEQEVVAEQERTRIARDMHDVVAHSLAVVVAQADGARYLRKSDPDAVDDALLTISTTAREALSDVRVLLAQLRHTQTDSPQPTLVDLNRLIEQMRSSGLTVDQQVTGTPLHLGTSGQLAVFRIVQESLTNALRHADISTAVVLRFAWTPHGLDLTIASSVRPPTGRTGELRVTGTTHGHGISGMRERALLVGGQLTAADERGRFVVHAWLPAQPDTAPIDIVRPTASTDAPASANVARA